MNTSMSGKIQKLSILLGMIFLLFACTDNLPKTPEKLAKKITKIINNKDQSSFNGLIFNRNDTLKIEEIFIRFAKANKGVDVTRDVKNLKDNSKIKRTHKRAILKFHSFLAQTLKNGIKFESVKFSKIVNVRRQNYKGLYIYTILSA